MHRRRRAGLARAGGLYAHLLPVLTFIVKGLAVQGAVGEETVLGMLTVEVQVGDVMFQVVVKRYVGFEQVVKFVNVVEDGLPKGFINVVVGVGVVGVKQAKALGSVFTEVSDVF